jgi:hypothetical protein
LEFFFEAAGCALAEFLPAASALLRAQNSFMRALCALREAAERGPLEPRAAFLGAGAAAGETEPAFDDFNWARSWSISAWTAAFRNSSVSRASSIILSDIIHHP